MVGSRRFITDMGSKCENKLFWFFGLSAQNNNFSAAYKTGLKILYLTKLVPQDSLHETRIAKLVPQNALNNLPLKIDTEDLKESSASKHSHRQTCLTRFTLHDTSREYCLTKITRALRCSKKAYKTPQGAHCTFLHFISLGFYLLHTCIQNSLAFL